MNPASIPRFKLRGHLQTKSFGSISSSSKEKLHYNKWYIKPEQRMKVRFNTEAYDLTENSRDTYFYDSLYKKKEKTQHALRKSGKLAFLAEKVAGDKSLFRTLSKFKAKNENTEGRVPRIIEYLIEYGTNHHSRY